MLRKRAAFRRFFSRKMRHLFIFKQRRIYVCKVKVVWREQASGLTAAVVGPLKLKVVNS